MKRKRKKLPIRIIGDKVLRKKAKPIEKFDEDVKILIEDMIHTMYENDGIGLAAPQVGKSLRIFIVDPTWGHEGEKKNPRVYVNPEFVEFSGQETGEEGCLSIPDIFEKVKRAEVVKIKALDKNGIEFIHKADGLFARSLQHEYDHLHGILFTDKVPKLRKIFLKKKLNELKNNTDEKGNNIKE